MKKSIINYNDQYSIETELISTLPSGIVIFKALVTHDEDRNEIAMAHASGYPSDGGSINDIELEAINRAFSLIRPEKVSD